ncbi:DUF4395 domain-containing protein [Pontimonas sp.]|jgi:hypothetical protein|nr:DUF4395 domain-containing protein [Microbacteriaceae bacterium]MDA9786857.1 DUF4395 domain-containing protein [Pontimonas sp.]
MNTSSNSSAQIDPRGPRFGAAITSVLLLVTVALGLAAPLPSESLASRLSEPAFVLLAILSAVFAWGAFAGVQRHPYGVLFKALIRPRLGAPEFLEETKPPTFAQLVGFLVSATGIVLHLAGVPYGLVLAAAAAFIAAFLNAVFGLCLGCELYALLVRARIIRSA